MSPETTWACIAMIESSLPLVRLMKHDKDPLVVGPIRVTYDQPVMSLCLCDRDVVPPTIGIIRCSCFQDTVGDRGNIPGNLMPGMMWGNAPS